MSNTAMQTPHDGLTVRELEILESLSAGLSDQEIATEVFLSVNTVKWYNRQIYSKLGVSSRTQAIAYAVESGLLEKLAATTAASLSPLQHHLPVTTTSFVGRSREIADLKHLLRVNRLLTLTGAGGIGKTRLSLQVVDEVKETFSDGVYFVDLAPLSDPSLVIKAITSTLGIVESSTQSLLDVLKRVLGSREVLLLIDNFEHVISMAPVVSELLAACPGLKVMVTSRESLRLSGEQEYSVSPLSLPASHADPLQSLMASEAGLLFIQRAQMRQSHFEVNQDNAAAIVQICNRLDGLPLALELAAARSKLLTPQLLAERLERREDGSPLRVLGTGSRDAPPRHQTLWDTIGWSYNLLAEDEKRLFERLAVFRGGRTLEAIEAICAENLSTDVYDALASLLEKNLVRQVEYPDGEIRFTLLEMIHEYAREQLEASGEAETMRRRHAEYFVALAERVEPELRLAGFDYWSQRFDYELDNFRAVLERALAGSDVTLGARLAVALVMFWYGRGYHIEGIHWTKRLLERLDEMPVNLQPAFLICAGYMAFLHDLDTAKIIFEKALRIARELNDPVKTAWALILLAYVMLREARDAMVIAQEGLALFRELDHQPGIAQALNIVGEIARVSGDDEGAARAYEECLAICQQTGEARRICYMYYDLCYIAQHEGDLERALDFGRRGLRLCCDRKDVNEMAHGLAVIAGCYHLPEQAQQAARLLGASQAVAERIGAYYHPSDTPELARIIAGVRSYLDPQIFDAMWVEGRKISLDKAVADALEEAECVDDCIEDISSD